MTKKITITLLIVLVLSMSIGLVGCNEYGNIPFELQYGDDNSVAKMAGDQTKELLKGNPYRGFSVDIYMTVDNTNKSYKNTYAFPNSCNHDNHKTNGEPMSTSLYIKQELAKYSKFNPNNLVLTVFLNNFIGDKIGENALQQIYDLLRDARSNNQGVVIKFAYQHTVEDKAPSVNDILSHMTQLGEWLNSSYAATMVKNVITAFRLSFVGIDGNYQNHSYSEKELAKISDGFAKMIPDRKAYYTQAPNIEVKNYSSEYTKLINMGFFNNNFNSKENAFISGGLNKSKKAYKQYVYQSRINFNSAGVQPLVADIDGKAVLRQMKDGYFSLFNLSSMYSGDANSTALLDKWESTVITKKDLNEYGLPYYDEWFLNSDGTSQTRSVLDYMRDFLGYNLVITNFKLTKGEGIYDGLLKPNTTISFTLTNYGMAAPLFIDKFELYIKNNATNAYINKGNGLTYPKTYDPKLLVCGGQINFKQVVIGDINNAEGDNFTPEQHAMGHSIGIKMYNDRSPRDLYVRLNNNVPYRDNINWIYSTMNK